MRRRPLRRKTEPSAGEADGSDSEVEDPPQSRSHTGVNPTMMNPGFGNGASHPLGWSGMGPKRAATEGPAEPRDAAFGWAEMAHGAYKDFLAAAAQVPEAMPRPVPLNHDLRVVLNVPSGSPVAREMCIVSVKEETTAKPVQRPGSAKPKSSETEAPPPEEDYDGACGVIVSASEDAEGCWTVEATRKGVTHILRVPGYGLLWQGAPVLVAIEGEEKEEAGLLAAERPERSTGLWLVEIHKTLALLPGNLRERRLPGFEDEGGAQLPLVRGVSVELCDLRAGAAYNGLSGVVLSSAPNARGRWEVCGCFGHALNLHRAAAGNLWKSNHGIMNPHFWVWYVWCDCIERDPVKTCEDQIQNTWPGSEIVELQTASNSQHFLAESHH